MRGTSDWFLIHGAGGRAYALMVRIDELIVKLRTVEPTELILAQIKFLKEIAFELHAIVHQLDQVGGD